MATAHPRSRFHNNIGIESPQRPELGASVMRGPMPPWARRLAASMCLIHGATIGIGLLMGGPYLALGAFGVVMLGSGAVLLYTYRNRVGGAEGASDSDGASFDSRDNHT